MSNIGEPLRVIEEPWDEPLVDDVPTTPEPAPTPVKEPVPA